MKLENSFIANVELEKATWCRDCKTFSFVPEVEAKTSWLFFLYPGKPFQANLYVQVRQGTT
jgi:hypothetical protein